MLQLLPQLVWEKCVSKGILDVVCDNERFRTGEIELGAFQLARKIADCLLKFNISGLTADNAHTDCKTVCRNSLKLD